TSVRLWDRASGTSQRLAGDKFGGPRLQFSPDGTKLRGRHATGAPPIWKVPSGEPIVLPDGAHHIGFAPEGEGFVLVHPQLLELYDGVGAKPIAGVRFEGTPSDVAILRSGEIAVSLGDALGLWNPRSGRFRRVPAPHDTVRVMITSADGRAVVTCGVGG